MGKLLFNETDIVEFLKVAKNDIVNSILSMEKTKIVDTDINKLIQQEIDEFAIKPLKVDFDNVEPEVVMTEVPGSQFPSDYDV